MSLLVPLWVYPIQFLFALFLSILLVYKIKLPEEESKFLYTNLISLTTILIAVIFLIGTLIANIDIIAADSALNGLTNQTLTAILGNCGIGYTNINFNLTDYYSLGYNDRLIVAKTCSLTFTTRTATLFSLIMFITILFSFLFRIFFIKSKNSGKQAYFEILMWALIFYVLIAEIYFVISFLLPYQLP